MHIVSAEKPTFMMILFYDDEYFMVPQGVHEYSS